MNQYIEELAFKANQDAKRGRAPSTEYMKVVSGKKKRAAKKVGRARVLGLIERAIYGDAS